MTSPHGAEDQGAAKGGAASGGGALRPLQVKPRKKLLVFLCVAFAAWIGVLLLIYFKMVYPLRHP